MSIRDRHLGGRALKVAFLSVITGLSRCHAFREGVVGVTGEGVF